MSAWLCILLAVLTLTGADPRPACRSVFHGSIIVDPNDYASGIYPIGRPFVLVPCHD